MNTKLTLTLKKKIIEQAKEYAAQEGRSLSEIVENYFKLLVENREKEPITELSPRVKKLKGILKVDKDFDFKKVLEDELIKKYNG